MLGMHRVGFALALVTAVTAGCGGTGDTPGTGGSGGTGGSTSSVSTGGASTSSSSATASSSSGGPDCPTHEGTVFAVTKLFMGDGNSGQWKKFGFNIDGKESIAASQDLCKPNSDGQPGVVYPDGDDGIDNAFGKNLLPLILGLYPEWVNDMNFSLSNGDFNVLLKMECLTPTGDVPAMTTKLFGATPLGVTPKFDGTDVWPVQPELLGNPLDPTSSTVVFNGSSVTGQLFDSGKGTFILTVPVYTETDQASIKLTLHSAKTTMILSPDRKSATGGMVGGVLNTQEFEAEIKKIGKLLELCDNSLLDSLITALKQASDIMTDGSQDPNKTCDGVSMGFGFEMKEVQLGVVGPPTPVGDACP